MNDEVGEALRIHQLCIDGEALFQLFPYLLSLGLVLGKGLAMRVNVETRLHNQFRGSAVSFLVRLVEQGVDFAVLHMKVLRFDFETERNSIAIPLASSRRRRW